MRPFAGPTLEAVTGRDPDSTPTASPRRVFVELLWRDVFVTARTLPAFLAQVVVQPLLLVFVFGKVLTTLGYAGPGYPAVVAPGVVALTCVLTGLAGTAPPMAADFSDAMQIEDRLLAPLPTSSIALEKVVFGAVRGLLAGVLMIPIARLVLGHVPFDLARLPLLVVVLVLASVAGAAMGLALGSLVAPDQITVVFTLLLTPLLFTGCAQYAWPSLSSLLWFKILVLANPLTYASEAMRASMAPQVAHMNPVIAVAALLTAAAGFTALGVRGFLRRALG